MGLFGLFGKKKDKDKEESKGDKQMPAPPKPPSQEGSGQSAQVPKPSGYSSGQGSENASAGTKPPTPPSSLTPGSESGPGKGPKHVDDLGPGTGPGGKAGASKESGSSGFELPELDFPELGGRKPAEPAQAKKGGLEGEEVKKAVEKESKSGGKTESRGKPSKESEGSKEGASKEGLQEDVPFFGGGAGETPEPEGPEEQSKERPEGQGLEEIEEPIELKPTPPVKEPVFVRSDKFKEIKDNINGIRTTLGKADETTDNLNEVKNREDSQYEAWHGNAESVQRKLLYIDNLLFEENKESKEKQES